ncbi:MAG: proline racemase family protein [Vulcanimicrobiaceae bacterium]
MQADRVIECVESHTQGMPTRVVTAGVEPIPGANMFDKREFAEAHLDDLRRLLMFEPRGHGSMSGAILMPPTDPQADLGVLFIEVSGFLPMCGHGTIGVCTVAVETGLVTVTEPVTHLVLDTPAGRVSADVEVRDGRAIGVTVANVPAFLALRDQTVDVPGIGLVPFDLAYGGNFYAIVPAHAAGLTLTLDDAPRVVDAGMRIVRAIDDAFTFAHPQNAKIDDLRHVLFTAPAAAEGAHSKGAIVLYPGTLDRSPCGTGTSARMAQRYFRGEQRLRERFVHESFLGSPFTGTLTDEVELAPGVRAVLPTITGRAWITGYSRQVLAADDPFPSGFLISQAP